MVVAIRLYLPILKNLLNICHKPRYSIITKAVHNKMHNETAESKQGNLSALTSTQTLRERAKQFVE